MKSQGFSQNWLADIEGFINSHGARSALSRRSNRLIGEQPIRHISDIQKDLKEAGFSYVLDIFRLQPGGGVLSIDETLALRSAARDFLLKNDVNPSDVDKIDFSKLSVLASYTEYNSFLKKNIQGETFDFNLAAEQYYTTKMEGNTSSSNAVEEPKAHSLKEVVKKAGGAKKYFDTKRRKKQKKKAESTGQHSILSAFKVKASANTPRISVTDHVRRYYMPSADFLKYHLSKASYNTLQQLSKFLEKRNINVAAQLYALPSSEIEKLPTPIARSLVQAMDSYSRNFSTFAEKLFLNREEIGLKYIEGLNFYKFSGAKDKELASLSLFLIEQERIGEQDRPKFSNIPKFDAQSFLADLDTPVFTRNLG